MMKVKMYCIILMAVMLFWASVHGKVYAVDFDARDTKIDLPVLSEPNNAITPHISADNKGHVYVVWSDNKGGSPSIYGNIFLPGKGWLPQSVPITSGFPRPSTDVTGDATTPQVCSDGSGHVYVVWVDDRAVKAGTGQRDIYFRYSDDHGFTWYPEFIDERIDTDNPTIGDSINPRIACDGNGNVYVVWEDNRNSSTNYEVYFRSFQVPSSGPKDVIVYYQTPDVRLNTGVTAGQFSAQFPSLWTDKRGYVYVAWKDDRNIPGDPEENIYPGIYFNVSNKHGADNTWLTKASHIDRAPVGGALFFSAPVISSDSNGNVYAAWADNAGRAVRGDEYAADGTSDVYFNRSPDYGITWGEEDIRINSTEERETVSSVNEKKAEIGSVNMAANDRGIVSIIWADNRSAPKFIDPEYNIYFNHSENFGRSFLDTQSNIRIDTGVEAGITSATTPLVRVAKSGNIFAAWVDIRSGASNIYFNFSINKGKEGSWQEQDIRLDYPTPPGKSINPVMAIDDSGNVYVAWQDTKSSLAKDTYNIFFISGFLDIESLLLAGQRVGEACFIATAAYGSPFEPHVELLRKFRDRHLLTSTPGKWFVAAYYRWSPPLARFISEHDYLKPVVRTALLPVVGIAAVFVHTTTAQKIALFLAMLMISGVASVIIVRRTLRNSGSSS